MNTKIRLFIMLLAILAFSNSFNLMKIRGIDLSEVQIAYGKYRDAQNTNQSDMEAEYTKLEEQKLGLQESLAERKKSEADLSREYTEIRGSNDFQENIDSSKVYSLITDNAKTTNVKVEKFTVYKDIQNLTDDTYTISVKGSLVNISGMLNTLMYELSDYNVSVGNLSIRQDYDIYNLQRPFDSNSLLYWYDKKAVNKDGMIIGENEGKSDIPTQPGKSSSSTTGSTNIKFDDEGYERALDKALSSLEDDLDDLTYDYKQQMDDIEDDKSASEETRRILRNLLKDKYAREKEALESKIDETKKLIKAEYDQKLQKQLDAAKQEEERKQTEQNIIQNTLIDPTKIIYNCDITIKLLGV